MKEGASKKAWVAVLKGSIVPLIVGTIIFALFRIAHKKYTSLYEAHLSKIFTSLVIIFITFWIYKISASLFNWYAANIASKTKTDLDDKFIPLFKRTSITIIWVIGLIIVLGKIGVNISALVATLGVSSLAIALAAKDTIANIIAGFLIMLDRPFCVGDSIKLSSGEKVKVVHIGIRRSRFLMEDNAIVIMPNLELSKSKIINYTYRQKQESE